MIHTRTLTLIFRTNLRIVDSDRRAFCFFIKPLDTMKQAMEELTRGLDVTGRLLSDNGRVDKHRRGEFNFANAGISMGNGQQVQDAIFIAPPSSHTLPLEFRSLQFWTPIPFQLAF